MNKVSIQTTRFVLRGTQLSLDNIEPVEKSGGISWDRKDDVLFRTAKHSLEKNSLVTEGMLNKKEDYDNY